MKANYEMDMCNGPIMKKMIAYALPLMCSGVLQALFNLADTLVVGRFVGDNALAAVGCSGTIVSFFINFFIGIAVGVNVLVGQFYGAKKDKDVQETVQSSILFSVIGAVGLGIVAVLIAPLALRMLQTPETIIPLASVYLRVYFIGLPASALYNFLTAVLSAVGDTKHPLLYLGIGGIQNIILNLVFVGVFHWGVLGVSLATVLSQTTSALLLLKYLMRVDGSIKVNLRKIKYYPQKVKSIFRIGLPSGIQSVLFIITDMALQVPMNSFGATVLAGGTAAGRIDHFIPITMNAFCQATVSFTSQNIGAKCYHRLTKILLRALGCVVIVGGTLGIICFLLGPSFLQLFTKNPQVIEAGMIRFKILSLTYVLSGITSVLDSTVRGMGYSILPTVVSLIGTGVITSAIFLICYIRLRRKINENL